VPDLQALFETAAHQRVPDHVGFQAALQRVRPDALGGELRHQLVRRHSHPRTHAGEGAIDLGGAGIDAEFLAFLDLYLLVDQFLDHGLAVDLLARQSAQFDALIDVEIGDRLAIDHDGDGLGEQRRGAAEQQQRRSHHGLRKAPGHRGSHVKPPYQSSRTGSAFARKKNG
jgi:hypothetical protein